MLRFHNRSPPYHLVLKGNVPMWECANGWFGKTFPRIRGVLASTHPATGESDAFHLYLSNNPDQFGVPVCVDYWSERAEFPYSFQGYISNEFRERRYGERARRLVPASSDRDRAGSCLQAGLSV